MATPPEGDSCHKSPHHYGIDSSPRTFYLTTIATSSLEQVWSSSIFQLSMSYQSEQSNACRFYFVYNNHGNKATLVSTSIRESSSPLVFKYAPELLCKRTRQNLRRVTPPRLSATLFKRAVSTKKNSMCMLPHYFQVRANAFEH